MPMYTYYIYAVHVYKNSKFFHRNCYGDIFLTPVILNASGENFPVTLVLMHRQGSLLSLIFIEERGSICYFYSYSVRFLKGKIITKEENLLFSRKNVENS